MNIRRAISAAAVMVIAHRSAIGQQVYEPGLVAEPIVAGLSNPTGMTFVGPGRILVNEQSTGRVRLVIDGVLQANAVLDLPVATGLEPGLLGMAKHRDFAHNGYIYLYYTLSTVDGGPRIANRISRFTWNGSTLNPASEFIVHELPAAGSGHHGGVVAVGLDGTIYAIIGDQHVNEQTINFQTGGPHEVGVVVRFNQDGSIPADNPFQTTGWRYIYAYGIRNSYGIGIDPLTGRLWQSENGTSQIEEVNYLPPGCNSGWESTFGFTFPPPANLFVVPGSSYSQPEFEFRVTAAPTSVAFLTSPVLGEGLWYDLFVGEGNFSSNHRIFHFELNAARDGLSFTAPALQDMVGNSYAEMTPIIFADGFGIITDIEIGPDGFMYVLDRGTGRIIRIRPNHPTGDGDGDGDIDFADFAILQACTTSQPATPACREKFDFNADMTVDTDDFATFLAALSGPLSP